MSNSTVARKSRRFLSSKYPETEFENIQRGKQGEEIFHISHPYHPLVQVSGHSLFTCKGCKEYGAGKRFRCKICEFDMHDFCALAPVTLLNHPLHQQHQLVFFTKSGGFTMSRCDICACGIKGYSSSCITCGFVMHPSCATMSAEMNLPTHQRPLTILPPNGGIKSGFSNCDACHKKRLGRVYCCLDCGYNIHALCAKDVLLVNVVHGMKPPKEKSNMFGAAAKVAGHALFRVIDGLIEGIGEGIGDALMDTLGRSVRKNTRHQN